MRRITTWLTFVALLSACGVPLDSDPVALDIGNDPPPNIDVPLAQEYEVASMYLVREGQLVGVTRDLPAPPTVAGVIESLLEGTTDPEERAGLRTSIPPETELISVVAIDGVATVNLTRAFTRVGGEEEILAVAQLVLTLVAQEGVDSVVFELDGIHTDIPVVGGALTRRPVGESDYVTLLSG